MLTTHGYEIRVANDGEAALDVVGDWPAELIITDISTPNMNGIELTKRVRARSEVPIIALSVRSEERAKVEALDAGADDYVRKPFSMNELLARIRANLRRFSPPEEEQTKIRIADFEIDFSVNRVFVRGKEVRLTPKELDLLAYFARNPHRVISHSVLLRSVWGPQSAHQNEYLRVFIGQLRKKIEADTNNHYIATEQWVGLDIGSSPAISKGTPIQNGTDETSHN